MRAGIHKILFFPPEPSKLMALNKPIFDKNRSFSNVLEPFVQPFFLPGLFIVHVFHPRTPPERCSQALGTGLKSLSLRACQISDVGAVPLLRSLQSLGTRGVRRWGCVWGVEIHQGWRFLKCWRR